MTTRLKTLDRIDQGWRGCVKCELHKSRSKVVAWRGNPDAKIAIIGGHPTLDDDAQGLPFVGHIGRKLDDLLMAANLDPSEEVFMINMVGCRTPIDRKPKAPEIAACGSRTSAMLAAVDPTVFILMGVTAARMAGKTTVNPWRGSLLTYEGSDKQAVITFHPAYILQMNDPKLQRQMVSDIKVARSAANL